MRLVALIACLSITGCEVSGTVFDVRDGAAPVTRPSWRTSLAPLAWHELTGASMTLAPSAPFGVVPRARIDGWAGLAVDARATVYCTAAGGREYLSNEVLALPLADDAPRWARILDSSPESQLIAGAAYAADGRPSSRDSFYGVLFSERRARVLLFGGDVGEWITSVDGFDPVRLAWDPAGTYAAMDPDVATGGGGWATVIEPETGDVYVFAGSAIYRWVDASSRWTVITRSAPFTGYHMGAALDGMRHRILLAGFQGASAYTFSLDDFTVVERFALAGTGLEPMDLGLVYVPSLDAFLAMPNEAGAPVIRVDAASFAVSRLATTGGETIPAGNTGALRRFLYVDALGGVFYYPLYEGNPWFLATE